MRDETDTQEYSCVILNCFLYVKVSKMSDAIYKEFHTRFLSGKEKLMYQFRRMNVKELKFPIGSNSFVSSELFPDSEVPSKIFFVCVFNKSKQGQQTKNPYNFWRKFMLKKNLDTAENLSGAIEAQYIKESLSLQMAKMKHEMANNVVKMKKDISNEIQNAIRLQFEGLQLMMLGAAGSTATSTPTNNTPPAAPPSTSSTLPSTSGTTENTLRNKGPPCLIKKTRTRATTQQTQQPILRDDDTRSEISSDIYEDAREATHDIIRPTGVNLSSCLNLGPSTSQTGVNFINIFCALFCTNVFYGSFSSYVSA